MHYLFSLSKSAISTVTNLDNVGQRSRHGSKHSKFFEFLFFGVLRGLTLALLLGNFVSPKSEKLISLGFGWLDLGG